MIRIDKNIFTLMQYSRLIRLAGDDFRALGLIVRAWILGETHWLKHKCIPLEYWPAELDLIIEAGLAHQVYQENKTEEEETFLVAKLLKFCSSLSFSWITSAIKSASVIRCHELALNTQS